jgi:hypothetical protein
MHSAWPSADKAVAALMSPRLVLDQSLVSFPEQHGTSAHQHAISSPVCAAPWCMCCSVQPNSFLAKANAFGCRSAALSSYDSCSTSLALWTPLMLTTSS